MTHFKICVVYIKLSTHVLTHAHTQVYTLCISKVLIKKYMDTIKVRKISLITGKGLGAWVRFKTKKEAIEYINSNQSVSGTYYYIAVDIKK